MNSRLGSDSDLSKRGTDCRSFLIAEEPVMVILFLPSLPANRGNKGKLVGQKAPLKLKDIWAIRVRLQISDRARDLALFNLRQQAASVRSRQAPGT